MCQSFAESSIPAEDLNVVLGFSPAFTKAIVLVVVDCFFFACLIPPSMASAIDFRTWSCLHLYRPYDSAVEQQLSICSNVSALVHREHAGVSATPHICRFEGLGSKSYTAWIRKLMR